MMASKLLEALAWAGDGAAHLRGVMSRLGEDAAPSALPGWSRAHVLTHIARNADAMINLLDWARTGIVTPAYPIDAQRDADIETGAKRAPAAIVADVLDSSDRLAAAVRRMPESAWKAEVTNRQGERMPATTIPWTRAREMWIHTVDLDVGATFADFPAPMLGAVIEDIGRTVGARPDCPPMRLVATDQAHTWTIGDVDADPAAVLEIRGPASELAAWLAGRSKGRALRTSEGARPPAPPRWL
jgi:maleylpyruvate isomerase